MKLGVMQPYFFPYIGYFQLIKAVDTFVVYDNVQFTKKGWFHRNRLLLDGSVDYFSINIEKDSDFLDVRDRRIAPIYFEKEMPKILRRIRQNYRKAPFFDTVFPFIESIFQYEERELFKYLNNALCEIIHFLNIKTKIVVSSSLPLNHELKNKFRVFDIYKYLEADEYINPSGGHNLYSKKDFNNNKVNLKFLEPGLNPYSQFTAEFIPGLSIIDVMMFNSPETIDKFLRQYKLN